MGSFIDPGVTARLLRRACRPLLDFPGDPHVEDRQVPEIERIVIESSAEPVWGSAVLKRLTSDMIAATRQARCSWECRHEVELAKQSTIRDECLRGSILYENMRRLIRRELKLVTEPPERVLFIGSGSLPLTGVFHAEAGARVTCVDSDPVAIEVSRGLLSNLGLSRAVRVRDGYGEEVRADRYDLVIVAALAKPKAAILANLRRTMHDGSHVLCRTAAGLRKLLYEPTEASDLSGFEWINEQSAMAGVGVNINTMLLRPSSSVASPAVSVERRRGRRP